jgi:hypothetical protein
MADALARRVLHPGATATGADHLTQLAFLDREIFRIQFAPPIRVSNFVNSVNSVGISFGASGIWSTEKFATSILPDTKVLGKQLSNHQ